MIVDRRPRACWYLTLKDVLTILCAIAVPVALGIYTMTTYRQEQQQADRARQFQFQQANELRQQTLYDEFLKNIYQLDKDGYLIEEENPWAFANAFYRAAHRQWDVIRKGDVLLFLKEKQLIGRNNCTGGCQQKTLVDIIRLNELSFDRVQFTSETGKFSQLNLQCVSFDQVSMANAAFSSVNLHGASFDGGLLDNVHFADTSLTCASFHGTQVQGTDFGNANLTGAVFTNVDLSNAVLTAAQIGQATFINSTMPQGMISRPTTTTRKTTTAIPMNTTRIVTTTTTSTTSTTTTTVKIEPLVLNTVQLNLDPLSLSSNWSLCYSASYITVMDASVLLSVLAQCNRSKLLLGCRPVKQTNLTVAAAGYRTDVLFDCAQTQNCMRQVGGVGWYFSSSFSWGFAPANAVIIRSSCDVELSYSAYRLCWHTVSEGGYRCGNAMGLNNSTAWEKVLYHAD